MPHTKLATRKQRLEKIMSQLKEANQPITANVISRNRFPDPPFLVPAVIEAIKSSRFKESVRVVPAEADSYCAEEAIAYETRTGKMATIITNDSDLLVQASGRQTRIMLLTGLVRNRELDTVKAEANVFFPAKLASAAYVDSLIPTAFFMSQDYHLSFDAAVAKAKKTPLQNDTEFASFQKELEKPDYSTLEVNASVVEVLEEMDPRIAELAHQLMPEFPRPRDQPANIFLVPLIEDVSKFSAWISGQSIRNAAYRMVLSHQPMSCSIAEYTRRGISVHAETYRSKPAWREDMEHYTSIISGVRDFLPPKKATAAQRFNYIAMYYALAAFAARGHVLSQEEIIRILMKDGPESREELHASAMCQAAIYSLRILKQLLALEKARYGLDEELSTLKDFLEEMPSLSALLERDAADTVDFWEDLAEGLLGTIDQE